MSVGPTDMSIRTPSGLFRREDCPHLSDKEWDVLGRMSESIGERGVAAMLAALPESEQHAAIVQFMGRELQQAEYLRQQADGRATALAQQQQHAAAAAASRPPRANPLKVDVEKYKGGEKEPLLRWLVELDQAVAARQLVDHSQQVAYAMSMLAGRAKTWAFGRRLADPGCFPTLADLKFELRGAFEPPKTEFRARTEFLDLKQGKKDLHAYTQEARHLSSCVVSDPIDMTTQVVTFMKGLADGPVKTYLFREYPETLEEAISIATQEDFSLRQAEMHRSPRPRSGSRSDGSEPMDLSSADARDRRPDAKQRQCYRCQKMGHMAHECMASRPAPRNSEKGQGFRRSNGARSNRSWPSKNGNSQ